MTTTALIMMIVAITLVWGGLAVAIVYLVRHPLEDGDVARSVIDGEPGADEKW